MTRKIAFYSIASLSLALSSNALALTFNGDICYKVRYTQRETGAVNESINIKLHVKSLDANTCVAHSVITVPGDNPAFVSGTCSIGPTNIYLNLVETQVHKENWVDSEIMQVRLDPATLNGTIRVFSHDYDTMTHSFGDGYASGTLTKIVCR